MSVLRFDRLQKLTCLIWMMPLLYGCGEAPYWESIDGDDVGEPGQCAPVCVKRVLTTCDENGREGQTPCSGDTPYCGYDNGRPVCVPPVCNYNGELLKTGETSCSGTVKVTCMEDNWALHENCADRGLVCRHGDCVNCEDGSSPFCFEDPNVNHLLICICDTPRG